MQAPCSQYSLPLQSTRVPTDITRPHTAQDARGSIGAEQQLHEADHEQEQTPRGSLAPLNMLAEVAAAGRGLSRDDTATDVTVFPPFTADSTAGASRARGSGFGVSTMPTAHEAPERPTRMWQTSLRPINKQRQQRRATFRFPSHSSASTSESSSSTSQKSTSFSRRLSRSCKEMKENMTRYTTPGIGMRRSSSTAHSIDPSSSSFGLTPSSPSKRNGGQSSDRPAKFLATRPLLSTKTDRKDTPAPTTQIAIPRPGMRIPTCNTDMLPYAMTGGNGARRAASAARINLSMCQFPDGWEGQEELDARRSRVGSLSSAADSGADLSSYAGSHSSSKDADGDVAMDICDSPRQPQLVDPLDFLPDEISLQVFEYLDAKDLMNAELVNSHWKKMTSERSVWRHAFLRKYDREIYTDPPPIQVGGIGIGLPKQPNQEWRKMFKARTQLDRNWKKGALEAGKAIYLSGHTDSVYCLQFDEEKIITGSRDRTIRVWDINNFTCKRVIGGPNVKPVLGPKVLRTVDYPDFHLATASVNGTAYGETIFHTPSQWHDASILCLQYDDKILVTGSSDSDLLIWDINTYEPITRLVKHTGGVLDVALDAKHIVSCSKDSRIIVWDRATYQPKGELTGHRGPVNAVQMRGKYLVSASGDGIARLWDLEQMKLVKEFSAKERGLAAVEFSEDMKYVLAGGNDTITYKFETETGREVQQFVGHSQLVRSLWLDSQNKRVVSGSYDLDIRVYDFDTGAEIWRAEEWTTSWMLAAKSDYRRIVATSQDGRILLVDFGLQKRCTPDDGQPIENVDLLRGTKNNSAIQWRNPWELARQQQRSRDQQMRLQALQQQAAAREAMQRV